MKKNNSLLITILGGAIFCFVCLGMVFLFPNSTKKLNSSNESAFPNADEHGYVPDEEISLGDEDWYAWCTTWNYGTTKTCSGVRHGDSCYATCQPTTGSADCTSSHGTFVSPQCCFGNAWNEQTVRTSCAACDSNHALVNGRCVAKPEITCTNPTYNGSAQTIATCTNGTITTGATQTSPGSYTVVCEGSGGTDAKSCSIKAASTPKPEITCTNPTYNGSAQTIATCTNGTITTGATQTSPGSYTVVCEGSGGTDAKSCSIEAASTDSGSPACSDKCCINGVDTSEVGPCTSYMPTGSRTCGTCSESTGLRNCSTINSTNGGSTFCNSYGNCIWKDDKCVENNEDKLVNLSGGGTAYVTPDECKTFKFVASGVAGRYVDATWSVTGSHQNHSCSGSQCTVTVCGWGCDKSETVTVSASYKGVTKVGQIKTYSYQEWEQNKWDKVPADGEKAYIYNTTSLDHAVCYGYSDPEEKNGVTIYKYRWNRCCGGNGGSTPTPTPTPAVPYCYTDDDGNYYWTTSPDSNWKIVDNITKEDNCKKEETEACYLTPSGTYEWGKHAKDDGYTLITAITTSGACKTPTDEACYKKDNDYIWTTSAPEGYEKVESAKTPAECGPQENPGCYLHGNNFVWGKYEKVSGYIFVENINEEQYCKTPDNDACYVDSKGDYVWGKYGDAEGYTLVPSVTEMSQCKNDVPTPKTDISISKIIYIFMAILMAFGVGFIYYSSTAKKNN